MLRWTDHNIQLVSCGENGWSDWDRVVIDGLARDVDFHSVHLYTGSHYYWPNVLGPHQAERALRCCRILIDRARYDQGIEREIGVAYDEWNVWFRADGAEGLEEHYTLADALAVATFLNIFVRQCATVRLANLAQLVNVIAPIVTSPDGLYLQTIYHPLRLHAEHDLEVAVDTFVHAAAIDYRDPADSHQPHRIADLGPFTVLDVAGSRDRDRQRLTLAVVNRDPEHAQQTTITLDGGEVAGELTAYEVNGPSPEAVNSFQAPDTVAVREHRLDAKGPTLIYDFAPHSFTLLKLNLA